MDVEVLSRPRLADTLIFAPTHNEGLNVRRFVDELLSLPNRCDVLIVDDASTDGTTETLKERARAEPRLRVIVRPAKLGIGSAHKVGWHYARDNGYQRIVTLDADLSHDPTDIPRLLALLDGGAEVALGSRFAPGGRLDYPLGRLILSRGSNLAARYLLRLPITEYTNSLRAARLDRVPAGLVEDIPDDGYSFFLTSVVRFVTRGLSISETPIHFRDRADGTSKISRAEITRGMMNLFKLARAVQRQRQQQG